MEKTTKAIMDRLDILTDKLDKGELCCLCYEEIEGYGNNPAPLSYNEKHRCCDTCNSTKVIGARLELIFKSSS